MSNELNKKKLSYEELGGREMLIKVAKSFYDKIYEDSWLGKYFQEIPQDVIESQQVDFVAAALGGPQMYLGKLPVPAHKHMMISEELFDLRENLLLDALNECHASEELTKRWLKIENAFRRVLVKKSISDCEKRYNTDELLNFPKPLGKKVA